MDLYTASDIDQLINDVRKELMNTPPTKEHLAKVFLIFAESFGYTVPQQMSSADLMHEFSEYFDYSSTPLLERDDC